MAEPKITSGELYLSEEFPAWSARHVSSEEVKADELLWDTEVHDLS